MGMSTDKVEIGRRVAEARQARGLSQQELAESMGIRQSSVSIAENEGLSQLAAIQRWAKALNVRFVWLAMGAGERDE